MVHSLRLLRVAARARLASPITVGSESRLRFRVMPGDLDINVHMNNGRYLMFMDLGRFDLLFRSPLWREARRRRWLPVIGSAMVRFRRSLRPFEAFELRTRLLCWDDRWFVFEQRFERGGALVALGLARGLFRAADGNVSPADTLAAAGVIAASPPVPEYVRRWGQADAEAYEAAAALEPPSVAP
jgi:acyl-CoA thioesterase FadM